MSKIDSYLRVTPRALALALVLVAAACGDDPPAAGDAGPPDAGPVQPVCGNSKVEAGEDCDDGNIVDEDECATTCVFTCGDGVRQDHEKCDTAIAAGQPDACPETSCSDGDACTTDAVSGVACQLSCFHGPITAPVAGDGCCPAGADVNSDADCPAGCGNGVVEAGETCDITIAAGQPGACPTGCDDQQACTTDALVAPGTCTSACTNTEITVPAAGDACCPAGANHGTDSDCSPTCGDGLVTTGELCDTGIVAGQPGACPGLSDCTDADACTSDGLLAGGTCSAVCTHGPVTTPVGGDGCCPPAGNANSDSDCAPVCGNHVRESGEDCDAGDTTPGDGCDAQCKFEPTAFRTSNMEIRDPHIYYDGTCGDITPVANFLLNDSINRDKSMPPDGSLDLNVVTVFRPLDQAAASGLLDADFGAACSVPVETTACTSDGAGVVSSTANNSTTGTCLETLPGTTFASYSPAITLPSGPCFVSDAETLDVSLGSVTIQLQDARLAGTYVGVPATQLSDGLMRGFISLEKARATVFPADLPLVGGKKLSELLVGGDNMCTRPDGGTDLDVGPDGVTTGWYFYINYTSGKVPYALTP